MSTSKYLTVARRILKRYTTCDWCLGRQFAFHGYGLSNKDRGLAIKTLLLMVGTETYQKNSARGVRQLRQLAEQGRYQPARDFLEKEGILDFAPIETCEICQGVMDQLEEAAQAVIKTLKEWEVTSILIGTKILPSIIEKEEQLRSELQIETGEPIKAELNREIGKLVTVHFDLPVDFSKPDIVAIVQIPEFTVKLQVNSVFIYGRYQKLIRGIPQTRWPCRECRGKGCPRCKNTGKMYEESVEELIAPPLVKLMKGTDVKFHGAGREDIDALMLGEGRPFVIEVLTPQIRTINLEKTTKQINDHTQGKVKVTGLRFANKEVVKRLKATATASKKVYKALVHVESPIHEEKLRSLMELDIPLEVKQWTPQRVLHRRADRVRKKRINNLQIKQLDDFTFELMIKCQGGLYVKEFVSGDDGRTVPSVAEILGTSAVCEKLDVMEVAISEEKLPW